MIRQKIVSGPNTVQQNFPNPQNKELNIRSNNNISHNIPIRNFSPSPNNFQRPLLLSQSEAQIHQKPAFSIQPPKVGITFNTQFNNQNTKINNISKPLTTNNSSVSIPY